MKHNDGSKKERAMAKAVANQYLKKPYARILVPTEDGRFSAEVLEFPGCYAHGNTPDEAFRRLEDAAGSWIEAALEQGQAIPEPFGSMDFGGKFALRLPRSLHRRAARLAEKDRISLNQFCVSAIAERVGAEDLLGRFTDKLTGTVTNVMAMVKITNSHTIIGVPQGPTPLIFVQSGRVVGATQIGANMMTTAGPMTVGASSDG